MECNNNKGNVVAKNANELHQGVDGGGEAGPSQKMATHLDDPKTSAKSLNTP